jgi:hypothetical protein
MRVNLVNFLKPILLLLIAYVILHFIAFGVFYDGFETNFELISKKIPQPFTSLREAVLYRPFNSNFLLFSAFKNPIFLIVGYLFLHPFVWNLKQMKWQRFDYNQWIRFLCFFVAFLLCWELTTYDFNYYLNTGFYFDRLLLIVFMFGILIHPIFIPAFIITALLYRSQFNFPIGGFPLFDKRVLFDLMLVSYTFFIVNRFVKIKTATFFFFVFCIIGGNYFSTFQAKILNSPHGVEWLLENKLNWLLLNAHSRGWMNFLGDESLYKLAVFLEKWSVILQALVLIIEGSAIFILFKRSISKYILTGFILMHYAIFSIGSMLFWKWMAIDLFMILFLWKAPKELLNELFSKPMKWASVVIIFFASVIFQNYLIGWHDTPYNQLYTYEVVGEDGETYAFSKNEFNPYHQLIQHDKFNYLNLNKVLKVSGFGYTSKYPLAKTIRKSSWNEVLQLKKRFGKIEFDEVRKAEYIDFLQQYFSHYNEKLNNTRFNYLFSAPHHIYNEEAERRYDRQTKVKVFKVFYDEYFIEGNVSNLKSRTPVLEVKI